LCPLPGARASATDLGYTLAGAPPASGYRRHRVDSVTVIALFVILLAAGVLLSSPDDVSAHAGAAVAVVATLATWLYLTRTFLSRPFARGYCPNCGYDVRADHAPSELPRRAGDGRLPPRCPECGSTIPVRGYDD
jgi:hypothetical protein